MTDWSRRATSRNVAQGGGAHNLKKEKPDVDDGVGRSFFIWDDFVLLVGVGGKTVGTVGSGPRIVDPCRPTAMKISAGEQRALHVSG